MVNVPRLDGSGPSWNEQRHLSHVSHEEQSQANHAKVTRETATWPRNSQPTNIRQPDAKVKTLRSRRSRNFTENGSQAARPASPPPPLPHSTSQTTPSLSTKEVALPKTVRKKHRRIVNLDGSAGQSVTDDELKSSGHQRSVTSPGTIDSTKGAGRSSSDKPYSHKSLPRSARNGKSSSRALTSATFEDPAMEALKDSQTDSGSEPEEFRKRMERLREEVGANNWLSVYANAVHSKQEP